MQTNGAEFLEKIEHTKKELSDLSQRIYTPEDVAAILAAIGTKMELFFKSVLFPTESPWRPFKQFVSCLEDHIDAEQVAKLQKFRELYNLARHNPRLSIGVIELQELIKTIEEIMIGVIKLDLGKTDEGTSASNKRIYWIAAWEHFDDAEVHIIVPSDEDIGFGPPELDMIHLGSDTWENAKHALTTAGKLDGAKGYIPDELMTLWEKSRGFADAICFEGEYRELLTCLAKFQSASHRMPGTDRTACTQYVLVACLVAFVDIINRVDVPDGEEVISDIIELVVNNYAMTRNAANLKEIATELANLAEELFKGGKEISLDGPLWASDEEFERLQNHSIIGSDKYPVLVDTNHRLIALHS